MRTSKIRLLGVFLMIAMTAFGGSAEAARIALIRDAEIENTIHSYAAPLFTAAGLDPSAVKIHLINDNRLNAFVAGGMNLFINTGLLIRAGSDNQIIGVIAHETGHIAGGHLARTDDALRGASVAAILATVLGAVVAAAGGAGGATAVIAGGQGIARQTFLSYSRTQERSADQFAVSVLDRTHQSARGLWQFLEILAQQDPLISSGRSPYLGTHPLTADRIKFIANHVANSPFSDTPEPPEFDIAFKRMQGKLRGFLQDPRRVLAAYSASDTGVEARYARAIAHFRRADLDAALDGIDGLIDEQPDDIYFHELKGQFLFENGHIDEAVLAYRRAVALGGTVPLIRIGLAKALVETNKPAALVEARTTLEAAVRQEPRNASAWRLLSIVYGRAGDLGFSSLASAEYAYATGRTRDAIGFAKRAQDKLKFGTPGRLRAEDIEHAAKLAEKRKKDK